MSSKTVADSQTRPAHQVHRPYNDRSQQKPSFIDPQYWQKIKASPTSPFPVKVYHMLEQVEQDELEHVVSWQPHGRCFLIHKQKEFISVILPRYMNLNKFASFQRQLNLYGFGRITLGRDKGAYYHEYLLRGKVPLALEVQRVKVNGTCVRGKANPDEEPNLWALPWLHCSNSDVASLAKTTIDTSHHLPLLHLTSNDMVDLCEEPFKVECCASFQPFLDFKVSPRELTPKRRSRNDKISTETAGQRQSVIQRNRIVNANSTSQNLSALCNTTEVFMNCGMSLDSSIEQIYNFQPCSESDIRSRGECDVLDLLAGPLCSDLIGQHSDIEPLTPQASADQDIFLDKMDIVDMLERVKSL